MGSDYQTQHLRTGSEAAADLAVTGRAVAAGDCERLPECGAADDSVWRRQVVVIEGIAGLDVRGQVIPLAGIAATESAAASTTATTAAAEATAAASTATASTATAAAEPPPPSPPPSLRGVAPCLFSPSPGPAEAQVHGELRGTLAVVDRNQRGARRRIRVEASEPAANHASRAAWPKRRPAL